MNKQTAMPNHTGTHPIGGRYLGYDCQSGRNTGTDGREKALLDERLDAHHQNPTANSPWGNVY